MLCNCFGVYTTKPTEGIIGKYLAITPMSGSTTFEVGSRGNHTLEG
jgi:hypothetical protein